MTLRRRTVRWGIKGALFVLGVLLILNPNLKRAALHIAHLRDPDSLIDPHAPELAAINREIDRRLANGRGASEVFVIEAYVQERIPYVSDYGTWGNIEYWPTVSEVLERGQEDCDGRAILAASIMRSRGFESAQLAVGMSHMWVQVDANEKKRRGANVARLLQPQGSISVPLSRRRGWSHCLAVVKALKDPLALREALYHASQSIPVVRRSLIFCLFLALYSYPQWSARGMSVAMGFGVTSSLCFAWPLEAMALTAWTVAWGLLALSLAWAWRLKRRAASLQGRGVPDLAISSEGTVRTWRRL